MRYYCAGEHKVPKVVMLALEHLVCLQRQVTEKSPAGGSAARERRSSGMSRE
jgi:hypothetical protein